MAPFGPWADLPPELLLLISNVSGLPLESYCRVRCVCTTWRSALPPPPPMLVTLNPTTDSNIIRLLMEHMYPVTALFLPAGSPFDLTTLPVGSQCVGSSNGWMAVAVDSSWWWRIFLFNPLAGGVKQRIPLPRLRKDGRPVSKIAFAPNPTPEDHFAVAICGPGTLAYAEAGDEEWTTIDDDVAARERRDRRLVDIAYDADAGKVYCVTVHGDVRVLRIPRRQPIVVEPLHVVHSNPSFDPAAYAPPYDTASKFAAGSKRIFFVGGSMYQLWRRNTTSAFSRTTPPGGARLSMAREEVDVSVLKYDPGRRPCWDAAADLGGCAAFVGTNNPVVLRPDDAPGVRANCVYWIDERSMNAPMVFDLATGASTLHPSADKVLSPLFRSSVCWYFLNDKIMSVVEDNGRRKRRVSGHDLGQVSKALKA